MFLQTSNENGHIASRIEDKVNLQLVDKNVKNYASIIYGYEA